MTQAQREEMAKILRGDLPEVGATEDMIYTEVCALERFVDDLVHQGEIRGKLEAWFAQGEYLERAARDARKAFDIHTARTTPTPF